MLNRTEYIAVATNTRLRRVQLAVYAVRKLCIIAPGRLRGGSPPRRSKLVTFWPRSLTVLAVRFRIFVRSRNYLDTAENKLAKYAQVSVLVAKSNMNNVLLHVSHCNEITVFFHSGASLPLTLKFAINLTIIGTMTLRNGTVIWGAKRSPIRRVAVCKEWGQRAEWAVSGYLFLSGPV